MIHYISFLQTAAVVANVIVSVPVGSLTLTGFAPTAVATANQKVAVPKGSLTLTGFAPTVSIGDAFWDDVIVLLQGDALEDVAPNPHTVTASGTAGTSGGYLVFDGSANCWITIGDSPDISLTGDYTEEAWVEFTTGSLTANMDIATWIGSPTVTMYSREASSDALAVFHSVNSNVMVGTSSFAINTLVHVARTRSGNEQKIWVDGVEEDLYNPGSTETYNMTSIRLGAYSDGSERLIGKIKGYRLTGAVRYTADFTPPTTPYPEG